MALVKTPRIVALLKVLASWNEWLSHGEIDNRLRKLSEKDWAYYQWGSSTLERFRIFEREGLIESEMRHVVQSISSARMCCQKYWTCDHDKEPVHFTYQRLAYLRFWRITTKGKKLAPTLEANTRRDFA